MKLTITRKLGSGFGIIILAVLINLYLTNSTGRKYQKLERRIITVLNPSRDNLAQLSDMMNTSKMLLKSWVHIDQTNDTPDKVALVNLRDIDFPALQDSLKNLSQNWTDEERTELETISVAIRDTLFPRQYYVMTQLSEVANYDDPFVIMEASSMVDEYGEVSLATKHITDRLNRLRQNFDHQANEAQDQITSDFVGLQRLIIGTNIILIIIVLISALYSHLSIVKPLKKIDALIGRLSKGNLSEKSDIRQNDEIGMIASSINTLIDGLRSTTGFANEMGSGHFDATYQTLSQDDVLGNSLLDMRASLQRADIEEQKRQAEDQRRNWSAQGQAKFAEILRNNNSDMDTLTQEVLFHLVRYVDANQGGIFVLNDTDQQHQYLEMRSCYAYDRKKFAEKRIEIGEGLVGVCYQEGETIYMTDVPQNYVEITSGLGQNNPTAILIVPLKVNEETHGVLELAAFEEFEPYKKEFIEKVSESIASTISALKVSERTSFLLEQAKLQTQEMSEQEEELRQNMEEMQATQEEWYRKEAEFRGFTEAINDGLLVIELSIDLEIEVANKNVLNKLGITQDKILHKNYADLLSAPIDMKGQEYKRIWEALRNGSVQETCDRLKVFDKEYVCQQIFIPQRDSSNKVRKILCITAEIRTGNS